MKRMKLDHAFKMADRMNFRRKPGNCNKAWRREQRDRTGSHDTPSSSSTQTDKPKPPLGLKGKELALWYIDRPKAENSKPPPDLKGKAIGLWYRDRQKLMGEKKNEDSQVMKVCLDSDKREEIENVIATVGTPVVHQDESDSFDHINDSAFKTSFLQKITTTFEDNVNMLKVNQVQQDEALDNELSNKFINKNANSVHYKKMLEFRENLPIFKKRQEILSLIRENQIIVLSGETGCGKTTQLVQYVLDDYISNKQGSICNIVCTQPRRISAITVAERVAAERDEELGDSVGYQIRLEKVLPKQKKGSILYVTTGVLLQWMQSNPALNTVSHLFLDEVHERDILCDFVITLMKDILCKRSNLKLILMSATLNAEQFSNYYGGVPCVNVPGFTYPVEEYYLEEILSTVHFNFSGSQQNSRKSSKRVDPTFNNFILPYVRNLEVSKEYSSFVTNQLKNPESEKLNLDLAEAVIQHICLNEPEGAILVFLPGLTDIQSLHKKLTNNHLLSSSKYLIIPLHSIMPTTFQRQVFDRPPQGVRKIILATNIAETSITINDVVYVVDSGRTKVKNFDMEMNVSTLEPEWESLANARQRRGRAGRVNAGKCYKLFTRAREQIFEPHSLPEMQRTRLEEVVLQAKMLHLGRVAPFLEKVMDPPDPKAVQLSLRMLQTLNALDSEERLTPLGYHLARLPMDPQMGKMILMGSLFSCVDPIFSIAASLTFKDPFFVPWGQEECVHLVKEAFAQGEKSDHLILAEAVRQWEEAQKMGRGHYFADRHFLSLHTLRLLRDMKDQFARRLYEMNYLASPNPKDERSNINSSNVNLVKAIICSGLYPNVAIVKKVVKDGVIVKTVDHKRAELHMKSFCCKIKNFETPFLVYHMKLKSSCIFIHDATMVYPMSLLFFGERVDFMEDRKKGHHYIRVDDMIKFECFKKTGTLVKKLRTHLDYILESKISNPAVIDWTTENKETIVLRAIVELITTEERENAPKERPLFGRR